jgi:hypothetical protein
MATSSTSTPILSKTPTAPTPTVAQASTAQPESKKEEIYTYEAPYLLYGMNWSVRDDPRKKFRLALGSFIEEYTNKVEVCQPYISLMISLLL